MNCPYCGKELEVVDYYGKMQYAEHYYNYPRSWIEKEGDIFECDCEESSVFNGYFYTDSSENLYEGYPC